MEKLVVFRSICRAAASLRSSPFTANNQSLRHHLGGSRNFYSLSPRNLGAPSNHLPSECWPHAVMGVASVRHFSEDVSHAPCIKDSEVNNALRILIADNWEKIPSFVIHDVKKALAKNTDDKAGQEALANAFCAAEAVEEFIGILNALKMELDDSIGISGENVKPLSEEMTNALRTVFERYNTYLEAFGPNETYLKKKVETELGTWMIHLKMRCKGLDSKWGKVTILGTSGLSGSYIEKRA